MDRKKLRFYAKYPFTEEASQRVLKDFDLDNVNDEFIEKTEHRIEAALKDQDEPRKHRKMIENAWEDTLIREIVSYPLTKITAAQTQSRYIQKKVAANESSNVKHYLQLEDKEKIHDIAREILELQETEESTKQYKIPLGNYLNKKPKDEKYKLVNMPVKDGYVYLDQDHLTDLISSHVYNSIANQEKLQNPPEKLKKLANEVKTYGEQTYTSTDYGETQIKAFPPCMKKIYNDLKTGKDVGHRARFVLATFMVNIGMKMEKMLEPFRGQENFDEEKTKYYLRHSAGKEGGGTEYNAPACDKMKSYGLCPSDCNTKHPLSYYKYRKKKMKEEEEE